MKFGIGLFFIGSMVQAQLMQSGAFEVYVNGKLQFSKLETGRMPDFDAVELILRTFGVHFWKINCTQNNSNQNKFTNAKHT